MKLTSKQKGLSFAFVGVLFITPDSLLVRLISLNSWELISKQGFDNSFKKMWDFYLSYCEAGFKSKNIDLIQFSLFNK